MTMKILGVILIVLGLLGFALGGISFTQEKEVADLGDLEVQTEETRTIPIAPAASGLSLLAGIILVFMGTRPKDTRV